MSPDRRAAPGADDSGPVLDMQDWVDHWKRVGPALEAERVSRLRELDESESARIAVELLWPLAGIGGDSGEGLRLIAEAFRRAARRP